MKRAMPWSDQDGNSSSSDESSSNSESEANERTEKTKKAPAKLGKRKTGGDIDIDALMRHGYKGGLSVLKVPPPKEKPNWSWSTGKDEKQNGEVEESYEERQKTRAALLDGEELVNAQTRKEQKNLSFSQKEKRKRELGQASRGKSYVEEEKRLLRDSGVYSGFDA